MLVRIGRFAKEHPFKFGCAFSCAKTSFSDYLVQTYLEKRERIDWRRNATFASFGLVYLGGVQYALYVPIFGRLFPGAASYAAKPLRAKLADGAGSRSMLMQVVLDQFVHHPLMYFPAFYSLKEVVSGGSVSQGLAKYGNNYQEDLLALWKLWVPSTIVNFAFMPMHLRIPWVATTSLFWTCILSYMRGGDDVVTMPEEAMDMLGSQGRSLQGIYDLGVSATPEYCYDTTKEHLLFTASGRDRIGFIQEVSNTVLQHGGAVHDVKAYKVGRDFVTIMLVESEPASVSGMVSDMQQLSQGDIHVNVQRTQPWMSSSDSPRCRDGVNFTGHLRAVGPDRRGMLLDLTNLLSRLELDIMSFSSNQKLQRAGPDEPPSVVFQMSGVVRAFHDVDRKAIADGLAAFNRENNCRVTLQETETDLSYSAFQSTHQSRPLRPGAAAARSMKRSLTGALPAPAAAPAR